MVWLPQFNEKVLSHQHNLQWKVCLWSCPYGARKDCRPLLKVGSTLRSAQETFKTSESTLPRETPHCFFLSGWVGSNPDQIAQFRWIDYWDEVCAYSRTS